MNPHSTYEALRHLADSWGLAAMVALFGALVAWPFRPGSRERTDRAAIMIFEDENDGE